MIRWLGIVSGMAMPLFNIPLILRIVRRKSSSDISRVWAVGAWICVMGMLPSSLQSSDAVLMAFGIMNAIFFSGVFISVVYYHGRSSKGEKDS